jgi:hypothetical protein
MHKVGISACLALLVTSCGGSSLPLVTGPSAVSTQPLAALNSGDVPLWHTSASCRAPIVSGAHGRIDLEPPSNDDYEISAEHENSDTNRFQAVPHSFRKVRPGRYEWPGAPTGRYQFAVLCGETWSAYVSYTVDGKGSSRGGGGGSSGAGPSSPPPLAVRLSSACTSHVFSSGGPGTIVPIAVPAGTYTLRVIAFDAAHAAGHQPGQIHEQLRLTVAGQVLGETADIPETDRSISTDFEKTGPAASSVTLEPSAHATGAPNSVHGACVEVWTRP